MNQLLKRTIFGLLFVAVIVSFTLYSEWSYRAIWALIGTLCCIEYLRLVSNTTSIEKKSPYYIIGLLYILIPIGLVFTIEPMMLLTILTIVWLNDTGAYIVGVSIGKHKMAPTISPKKSWEGFFGGLIFAIAAALVWYSLYWSSQAPEIASTTLEKASWALFGLIIGLAAVAGDLIESKFKRIINVKDSGNLIPGHGGILDRLDATLLAIPFAWIILKIWIS